MKTLHKTHGRRSRRNVISATPTSHRAGIDPALTKSEEMNRKYRSTSHPEGIKGALCTSQTAELGIPKQGGPPCHTRCCSPGTPPSNGARKATSGTPLTPPRSSLVRQLPASSSPAEICSSNSAPLSSSTRSPRGLHGEPSCAVPWVPNRVSSGASAPLCPLVGGNLPPEGSGAPADAFSRFGPPPRASLPDEATWGPPREVLVVPSGAGWA